MAIIVKSGTGTWTPVMSFATPGTSSFVYAVQDGTWTRSQDRVFIDFELSVTPTFGTGSGTMQIGGIPFDIADIANVAGHVFWVTANLTYPAGRTGLVLTANAVDQLRVSAQGSAVGGTSVGVANFTAVSTVIRGSLTYRTSE